MVKKYLIEKELFEDEQCFCNEQTEETRKKWIKKNQVIQVVKLSELKEEIEKFEKDFSFNGKGKLWDFDKKDWEEFKKQLGD